MPEPTVNITVRVPSAVYDSLSEMKAYRNASQNSIIVEAIRMYTCPEECSARTALEAVEWVNGKCPFCESDEEEGHTSCCIIRQALGREA